MVEDPSRAPAKVSPTLRSRLKVNRLLAEAYSVILSIEETKYLSNMPVDQMIDQAVRQLGRPREAEIFGPPSPTTKPPSGRTSRRSRLEAIQQRFKSQLENLQGLPDLSDPNFGNALMGSFGDAPGTPTDETTR